MKAYLLNRPSPNWATAYPDMTEDEIREMEIRESMNRDNWINLAQQIRDGGVEMACKSQWKSAWIGFKAIDHPDCQIAASICEKRK